MNSSIIKKYLENYFHVKFQVDNVGSEYIVSFEETNDNFFYARITIKDNLRLIIYVEPQKFGKPFVETINMSSVDKRTLFVKYWNNLGTNRLNIRINGANTNINEFIANKEIWESFSLRYSMSPYFEKENEKEFNVLDSLSSIIAMVLCLCEYSVDGYVEGERVLTVDQKYERNPINRKLCLLNKGYKCSVCGFDFEEKYGSIGKEYIEVHHSLPVSMMGENHIVDPINELFPLCSNCHSMIHKKNPPYTIDEFKRIIKEAEHENK